MGIVIVAQQAFKTIQICKLPHEEVGGRQLLNMLCMLRQAAGDYKASLISQQDAGGHGGGKNLPVQFQLT